MLSKHPAGEWEPALGDSDAMRNRFKQGEIEDILLVIAFAGQTPARPA